MKELDAVGADLAAPALCRLSRKHEHRVVRVVRDEAGTDAAIYRVALFGVRLFDGLPDGGRLDGWRRSGRGGVAQGRERMGPGRRTDEPERSG